MDICFVLNNSLNKAWQEYPEEIKGNDVVVFGSAGLGLISYKKELTGETEYFRDLANLSKELSNVIICGCDTDTYGVFRHSAVIADKGRILGVTDMAHSLDGSEFVSGGNFRVYDTSAGKIGIIISEDLFFPESARVLSLCDADFIVCLFKESEGYMPQVMLRAQAFSNGVAMGLCTEKYACISNIKGEILVFGRTETVKDSFKIEKDYRLISARRRGLYREFNSGY